MSTQSLVLEQPSVNQSPAYGVVRYTFVPSNMSLLTSNSSLTTGAAQMRQTGDIAVGAELCDTAIAWADLDRQVDRKGRQAVPSSSPTSTFADRYEPMRLKFGTQDLNLPSFDIVRSMKAVPLPDGPREWSYHAAAVQAIEDVARFTILWNLLASAATAFRLPAHADTGRFTTGLESLNRQPSHHRSVDGGDCETVYRGRSHPGPTKLVAGRLHSRTVKPEGIATHQLFQALDSLQPDQLKSRIVTSSPTVIKKGKLESRRDS